MALVESKMLPLGTKMPSFNLKDTEGQFINSVNFKNSRGYLVIFMCNHCPYVKHIRRELSQLTKTYIAKSFTVVGINSNDAKNFPDDSPEKMALEKKEQKYDFPYLFDETQDTARAFNAACTPDFYLFGPDKTLVYRGQFDGSRPGNAIAVTGADLKSAMDKILEGHTIIENQKPSIGCSIKWKQTS